jgi:hypothetical protein
VIWFVGLGLACIIVLLWLFQRGMRAISDSEPSYFHPDEHPTFQRPKR